MDNVDITLSLLELPEVLLKSDLRYYMKYREKEKLNKLGEEHIKN